jgi:hypothetical protein
MPLTTYEAVIVVYNDNICDIYLTNDDYDNCIEDFLENTMNMCLTAQLRYNSFALMQRCRELFDNEIGDKQIFYKQIRDLSLKDGEHCDLLFDSNTCFICDFRFSEERHTPLLCYSEFVEADTYNRIIDVAEEYAITEDYDFVIKAFPKTSYSIKDDRAVVYLDKSFISEEHALELANEYARENLHHQVRVIEHRDGRSICINSFLYHSDQAVKYSDKIELLSQMHKTINSIKDYLLEIEDCPELAFNTGNVSYSISAGRNAIKAEWLLSEPVKSLYERIHIGDEFHLKLYQPPTEKNDNKEFVVFDGKMVLKNTELKFDPYYNNNMDVVLCFTFEN